MSSERLVVSIKFSAAATLAKRIPLYSLKKASSFPQLKADYGTCHKLETHDGVLRLTIQKTTWYDFFY